LPPLQRSLSLLQWQLPALLLSDSSSPASSFKQSAVQASVFFSSSVSEKSFLCYKAFLFYLPVHTFTDQQNAVQLMQLAHILDEMYLICLPEIDMVFSSIPGVSVELSHDSAQVKALSSSAVTEYRVTVTDKRRAYYVFQKPFVCRARAKPCRSSEPIAAAGSFVNEAIAGAKRHEPEANGELAVVAEIEGAGVVPHVKSRVAPSAVAMGSGREKRLLGVLVDVPSPRRELGEARATARDEFSPVSNPATTPVSNPVTVPATNPMPPGFVTVPSTNPGNGIATNPNLPPLYPEPTTTPVTVPPAFTNPVAAPNTITMPGTAVTNPATTPTQFPGTSPVTNPVTTYPYPQQGGGGGGMPATTMPGTVQPGAPTVAGQAAWCVAKSGLMDTALQDGIDYACGVGGADCSAIQPMGACYNPNTLQAHASYAFNSYFQRNPSAASCDFGGAGMLVNVNPSEPPTILKSATHCFGTSNTRIGFLPTNLIYLQAQELACTRHQQGKSGSMIHPSISKSHLAITHQHDHITHTP
jgi:hypothetical protein